MDIESLVIEVMSTTLTPDVDEEATLVFLNQGMVAIAGGGNRPYPLPPVAPLPDLMTIGTVTATVDGGSVALPSNFQRSVISVINSSGQELNRIDSYIDFVQRYPKLEAGSIESYCVRGRNLYYAPSKAEDLTVHYYHKPVDMAVAGAEPDGLPEEFHISVLCAYACWRTYKKIERGEEGRTPNINLWNSEYMNGLTDLERHLGPEDARPQQIGDAAHYIEGG